MFDSIHYQPAPDSWSPDVSDRKVCRDESWALGWGEEGRGRELLCFVSLHIDTGLSITSQYPTFPNTCGHNTNLVIYLIWHNLQGLSPSANDIIWCLIPDTYVVGATPPPPQAPPSYLWLLWPDLSPVTVVIPVPASSASPITNTQKESVFFCIINN